MRIERIVLFGQAFSEGGAEAAAELAARFEAKLAYLFLEDLNLLRLAGLPFASEIGIDTACWRDLELPDLQRSLRTLASQAEEALSSLAQRLRIPWSFQVLRGIPSQALSDAACSTDLVLLLRSQPRVGIPTSTESLAREIVSRSGAAVLFLSDGAPVQPPFGVVFSGAPSGLPTLHLVAALASDFAGKLVVLSLGSGEEACLDPEFQQVVREAPSTALLTGIAPKARRILAAAAHEGLGLLALSIGESALPPEEIESICAGALCPILLLP
ncbi:hypothetical protein [Methylacidimicrobium tartarophylax]|uniref:UspA domain-containing protein n=1 Tax=Methylacidimicrobium tartarophylax TaxID=1041768 RepID=A0A5E6MEG2_9BACT|nr:hypothetical protein [Methylacidimicrobium tartarophylax]VVM07485.1 hypothetical protein MAMT_01769 [Methylacidimicrobium tartarophylax]